VLETGDRIGTSLAGGLLALLGADVRVLAPSATARAWKWRNPAATLFRKRTVGVAALGAELAAADVVLGSSDITPLPAWDRMPGQVVCDITAHGPRGPADSGALVAALTGLVDTVGAPDRPPVPAGYPLLDGLAALHAALAVLAALHNRRHGGIGHDIDITLSACGLAAIASQRPGHACVSRVGNAHRAAAPWNLYPAANGAVLLGATTDREFTRLAAAMRQPGLSADPRFATLAGRLAHRTELDREMAAWTSARTVAAVVAALTRVELAGAMVTGAAALAAEPNLILRGSCTIATDPASGAGVPVLARPFQLHAASAAEAPPHATSPDLPLRVLEIGRHVVPTLTGVPNAGTPHFGVPHFGVPSAGDHLAALGARVTSADHAGSNATLRAALAEADVLVVNRPGTMSDPLEPDPMGPDPRTLRQMAPRLIHCSVTPFGMFTAYPGRPGSDSVAQAMCGAMDLTRGDGVPFQAGAPVCAYAAGLAGAVAVLAGALGNCGCEADIAMQEVGAWLTHWQWNELPPPPPRVQPCTDGHVLVEDGPGALPPGLSRAELTDLIRRHGGRAAPVLRMAELD